jgi:antitoxin MazE
MITKVQKWGNSQGVRLSKELLSDAHIEVGDAVKIIVREGKLILVPVRRVRGGHDLRDLVRRVREDYEPGELDWGLPEGSEVW